MALITVLRSWPTTAALLRSTLPSSTSSASVLSFSLIATSSTAGRPRPPRLPPLEAARLRSSALAGSCHQQWVCGGSTVTVHREPSRLVPGQRCISLDPSPYPPSSGGRRGPTNEATTPRLRGSASWRACRYVSHRLRSVGLSAK